MRHASVNLGWPRREDAAVMHACGVGPDGDARARNVQVAPALRSRNRRGFAAPAIGSGKNVPNARLTLPVKHVVA